MSAPTTSKKKVADLKDVTWFIKERVEALDKKSRIFDNCQADLFPRLRLTELKLEKLLGIGSFSVVHEIGSIRTERPLENNRYESEEEDRNFLQSHCTRNGDARYAIKKLKEDIKYDAGQYLRGACDLAVESRFLAVVHHPHIVRMRAVADCSPYDDNYFIVLDRLYSTLDERILLWKKKNTGILPFIRRKSNDKTTKALVDKLVIAYQISRAMSHFHHLNIIYRDIKPENIGFDVRGDVKIFDLGFAKEVHEDQRLSDGTYKLTGRIGSLRYMVWAVYGFSRYLTRLLFCTTSCSGFGLCARLLPWSLLFTQRLLRW